MLKIMIPSREFWDEKTETFVNSKETTLQLEHSLVSLSKWESKWHKPFFGKEDKTPEQTIDYIRMMTLTQNVNPEVYAWLTKENMEDIMRYIDDPMTATWFSNTDDIPPSRKNEVVTSELIYYWMIAYQIPFECQKWHLNRLITLIKVCNVKNQPDKKMSKREVAKQQAAINAARRKAHHSRG